MKLIFRNSEIFTILVMPYSEVAIGGQPEAVTGWHYSFLTALS